MPVTESDGYYFLASWSGIPNLRLVASQLVRVLWAAPPFERRAELALRSRWNVVVCVSFVSAKALFQVGVAATLFAVTIAWLTRGARI